MDRSYGSDKFDRTYRSDTPDKSYTTYRADKSDTTYRPHLTYRSYQTYYFPMYTDLKSYQNSVIIHDFTVEFVKHYIPAKSRTRDQMEQAARSGKQNIAEATSSSKQKPKSEPMLLGVASASLKELLEDYQDYLRQHRLKQWEMNDPRALRVRGL